ncbi:MAG: histidine kinase [Chitinophagales bacterium]
MDNALIEIKRKKLETSTNAEEFYKTSLELIELLLYKDLQEAEQLAQNLIKESKNKGDNKYLIKGQNLLLRIYRATSRVDEGIALAELMLPLIQDKSNIEERFSTYNSLINLYIEKLQFKKAQELAQKVQIDFYKELSHTQKAHHHNNLGKLYEKLAYSDLAIQEFEKSITLFDKSADLNGKAKALFSIGLLFIQQQEYQEGKKYFIRTLEIDKEINSNNPGILLQSYMLIARCNFELKEFDEGENNYQTALQLAKEFNNPNYINRILSDKVEFLLLEEKHKECLTLALSLMDIEEFSKDTFFYTKTMISLAFVHSALKNYKEVIYWLERYFNARPNDIEDRKDVSIYLCLAEAYEHLEDYKNSQSFYKKYANLLLELEKQNSQRSVEQFNVKFETAQKERELEQLKLESLRFQLQSLRSQMNPHFIFNAISSLTSFLNANNTETSKQLLKSFARLMRANLEFAERDTIGLEEEIQFLNDYLSIEQIRMGENLNFEVLYEDSLDTEYLEIPSMLVQPFVENAIKHGLMPLNTAGKISISFTEEGDYLLVVVKDNGVGRAQAAKNQANREKHLGKSTAISQTRLALLDKHKQNKIQIHYIDLFDENLQNAMGTEVQIRIAL